MSDTEWFCNHDWELMSEHTTESVVEHAKKMGLMIEGGPFNISHLKRKYIQTFQCKKCGKFKRFVEILD